MNEALPPRILYVDRDDAASDLVCTELRGVYHLVRARGDDEALELWHAHRDELSAAVVDAELPGSHCSGLELASALRQERAERGHAGAAVILLERLTHPIDLAVAGQVSDAVLTKPLELARLTLVLADWLLREP